MSQQELANYFRVDRKTILRIENSKYMPKVDVLKMYAKYFNISLDYLCGLINVPRSLDGSPYSAKKTNQINNIHISDISGGNNKFEIH